MKKIRITEAQADMLANLNHKRVLRITKQQLNFIRESLGDDIEANFKKEFSGYKPTIKFEGELNEGSPTIEILELIKSIIEFILSELNNDSMRGLDPIFQEMGVTRGEIFTLLSDFGLMGMAFYQLSYNGKIKKIRSVIKTIAKELMQIASSRNGEHTDEMTGAASSGAFVAPMGAAPSKDYNDELSPSSQLGDGVLTDAESNFQEIKGLEVGTDTEYFTVNDVRDKQVDDAGNIYYMVTLNDADGNLTEHHLLFTYKPDENKAYLRFNRGFEKLSNAKGVINQVYHGNLNKIGNVLTKEARLKDEATGAAGNTGAFDANAFAGERKGTKAGHMVSNIDVNDTNALTSKEGSKPKDIRRESVSNMTDTAYPDGGFVEFDDCVKYNNNKDAENGGCNSGDSGVVKVKKSGNKSVISNQKGD